MPDKIDSSSIHNAGAEDEGRRSMALALFSALGGAALLQGCAPEGADEASEDLGRAEQNVVGTSALKWVDNISDLKAVTGQGVGAATTSTVVVLGRNGTTRTDGGGGVFEWIKATPPAADDGGTVFLPTVQPTGSNGPGYWKRMYSGPLNVRWFGAKGDGTSNDASAIASAATVASAGGCALYFPSSVTAYAVTTSLTISCDVVFDSGAIVAPSTGTTLVFSKSITAPPTQIFAPAGTAVVKLAAPGKPVDIRWFGAKSDGSDSTSAINKTFASLAATTSPVLPSTDGAVYIPPGSFKITAPTLPAITALTAPTSNLRIFGEGYASAIYVQDAGGSGTTKYAQYDALAINGSNVVLENVRFYGDDGIGATGFAGIVNSVGAQRSCIQTGGSNITTRSCTFENLYGHVLQNLGGGSRVHAIGNTIRYCANGININSNYSIQSDNHLLCTNGIEAGLDDNIICRNIITGDPSIGVWSFGIGIGGKVDGPNTVNTICSDNIIENSFSAGIVLAGCANVVVSGNTIVNSTSHGIMVIDEPFHPNNNRSGPVTIIGNRVSCTGPSHGIWIPAGTGHLVVGNVCTSPGNCGILIDQAADSTFVSDNIASGAVSDIAVQTAKNVRVTSSNMLVNSRFGVLGGATIASDVSPAGFFGRATGTQQTVTATSSDPAVTQILAALRAYGLLA